MLIETLNKLAKWRSVFASWQLGTRSDTDAECNAVKDHREVTILMRAELSAIVALMMDKGLITVAEWEEYLERAALDLDKSYEQRFPGYESTAHGMSVDITRAHETMKGWPL